MVTKFLLQLPTKYINLVSEFGLDVIFLSQVICIINMDQKYQPYALVHYTHSLSPGNSYNNYQA